MRPVAPADSANCLVRHEVEKREVVNQLENGSFVSTKQRFSQVWSIYGVIFPEISYKYQHLGNNISLYKRGVKGLYDFENQWMPKTAISAEKAFIFFSYCFIEIEE